MADRYAGFADFVARARSSADAHGVAADRRPRPRRGRAAGGADQGGPEVAVDLARRQPRAVRPPGALHRGHRPLALAQPSCARSRAASLPDRACPDDLGADADRRLVLREALARLTPRQRQVLVLRFYEDLTETQTAHAMHCSTSTVKSQTRHALARLRELAPELADTFDRASPRPTPPRRCAHDHRAARAARRPRPTTAAPRPRRTRPGRCPPTSAAALRSRWAPSRQSTVLVAGAVVLGPLQQSSDEPRPARRGVAAR